ncbi:MAG: hypothetical protein H7X80_00590 [bacterium]|nr:hypothetical protein [Candidatus Kapabacteria bacterium]
MMIRVVSILVFMIVPMVAYAQPVEDLTAKAVEKLSDTAKGESRASFRREVWTHALRQDPNPGAHAFGVTIEAVQYFGPRAHDRWRRNVLAEVLSAPMSWVRLEVGYDPESALITGVGGFHVYAEGQTPFSESNGGGVYTRFDRAGSGDNVVVSDFEVGGQMSWWSKPRRFYLNEKIGYRSIRNAASVPGVDDGNFVQLRSHLVYVPSEDWTLTYVQDVTVRIGFGSDPHTNQVRMENVFLLSPTLLFSLGPIVGVSLDYFVGPATSSLSLPVGMRAELHVEPFVVVASGVWDAGTIAGQRTAGLLLRGSAGFRF